MLRRLARVLDSAPRSHLALGLALLFALSRAAYFALGVRFNDYPLRVYWQFLAPRLLRTRLVESVFHLHAQPPLYNLYLGVVLKLAEDRSSLVFHLVNALCGLGVLLVSFSLMRRLGVSRRVASLLALWLVTSPAFVAYENWLFYSLPLAFLLALSALLLHRLLREGRLGQAQVFFGVLLVVAASRSLFHLSWFLLVAAGLILARPRLRGTLLRAAAIPLALLLSLYLKNLLVFGHFTLSTWVGMNLARLTVEELPAQTREWLLQQGRLSDVSRVPAFGRPWQYPAAYFAVEPRFVDVPAVSRLDKLTEAANYNHAGYIEVSRRYARDALYVIRHQPGVYLHAVARAWEIYFRSASSLKFLGVENRRALARCFDLYDYVFLGRVPWAGFPRTELGEADFSDARYVVLAFGLPLVFAYGVAAALGRAAPGLGPDERVLAGFLCFTIAWVALVGNLVELGENNRFRFETDPLSLVLLGVFVERTLLPGLRRVRGLLPAGGDGSATPPG